MKFTKQQQERLAFLEKRIEEMAHEKHLTEILSEQCQPLVIILEAEPKPVPIGGEQGTTWTPPRPGSFLSEHVQKRVATHPGMLFTCSVPSFQVGLTLEGSKLVFVPDALYEPYERECLQAVGWSEHQEDAWEESITMEDEETGEVQTPDWPNPVRRDGVWKARQVAHWTGEEEHTPVLNYSVWANGTWG